MAKTNASRNFSDLPNAIQILAQRTMSQVSSSFPSYDDKWDDSSNATEYYDIDDHNAVDNDAHYDEYNEPEDHDGERIDMSGILGDATFEEPELACMLENLQKGRRGVERNLPERQEGRDVLKFSTKETGKGGRPENYKQVRLKLQSDPLNRGWRDQPAHGTNIGRVAHSWLRWMISSLAPVVSNVESWGISRRAVLRKKKKKRNRPQIPRLSSVVWFVTIRVLVCLETNPVLTMILETSIVSKMNFKEKTKPSSMSEKMTFLDVRKDDETVPVPGSSQSLAHLRSNMWIRNWNPTVRLGTTCLNHVWTLLRRNT